MEGSSTEHKQQLEQELTSALDLTPFQVANHGKASATEISRQNRKMQPHMQSQVDEVVFGRDFDGSTLPEARQPIHSDILAPTGRLPLRQSRTPRRATQVRYLVACSGVTLLSPRYAARRAGRRRCVLHLVWLACCGYTDHDCTNLAYAYCGCTYGGCTYCDTIEDALATLYLPGAAAPWLHSPLFVYGSIYRSGRSPATTCCGARQPAPCSPHGVRGWGPLPRRPTLTLALTLTWP